MPGIFIAIHTFGCDLKRNVHIHLSVFMKGLSNNGNKLVNLFFSQKELMKQWKYKIVNLFREAYYSGELVIPE
ncbi:MAG: transposase [Legionellales bacterium]|nr:transposase [Legionellales bacterium]